MSEKALVSEAMADLRKELATLKNRKKVLSKSLDAAKRVIKSDRSKELELRERMLLLTREETELNERKEMLEAKLEKLGSKLEKITKISRELGEV